MSFILLPSKPRVVLEEDTKGVYEIDGLYPGYGHTLGNSLRRIILSSLPGAAVTSVKIQGADHEFSVLDGVKEDVISIILNLKKVRFQLLSDEPQTVTLTVKGQKDVTAKDIEVSGQVVVLNPDLHIAELTTKTANLVIEMTVEKGLGFISKDVLQKGKVDIGTIAMDAIFTPIRRVSYEVENMRVGDKTNHNRLRIVIETDGTLSPREALEQSVKIMIEQLNAIVGIKAEVVVKDMLDTDKDAEIVSSTDTKKEKKEKVGDVVKEDEAMTDIMKTRVDTLDLSTRTMNALTSANIRTLGGLARKKVEDLLELPGMGEKGIQEIKKILSNHGVTLK
jgi:DNA-directed RNA polymerase subunit alpha